MNKDDDNNEFGATDDRLDQTVGLPREDLRNAATSASGNQSTPSGEFSLSSDSTNKTPGQFEAIGSWIGPYRLIEEIGSGGMGTVFMAEQKEPVARRVALKIIKAGMDSEQVIARFEVERQALSMMEHPNIARVLDAGKTEHGRPYFVMELVQGEPITTVCDRLKLDIESRLELFCEVCGAVQHAHQKGIIHRDLKPSNILVAMHDGKCMPKVIDFGVAKATDQQLTEKTMFTLMGEVVGTLEYMSPEQAQMTDLNIDTRSDIYSLGVLLYELLTGSTPLKRHTVAKLGYLQILSRISDEEAPKPSSRLTATLEKRELIAEARGVDSKRLFATLRGDLDWIVLKALEKNRARRYETATGFADDVRRYLRAEPISARPPTGFYLLRKFATRHRAAVTTGIAILLTLIGGLALASWQAVRALRAETKVAEQFAELQRASAIEKQNEELSRKIERETGLQKATLAAQIRSTISRGQWQDGMLQIAAFQAEFNELPLEILMLRLYALDGLSKVDELKQEILRLEEHPDAAKFRPQLQLWHGYSFLSSGSGDEDGKALIQAAIKGGLDADDKLFAEGLVADSLLDATEKYERALRQYPFHSKARMQLITTLILLGRYEDVQRQLQIAKTLFPDDMRLYFADVVSHALANNITATRQSLKLLGRRFPNANVRDVRSLIGLSRSVNNQFKEYDRSGIFDWFSILPTGIPLFQDEKGKQLIPVPEFQKEQVFNAYGEFAKSFLNPLLPLMSEHGKHKTMISTCQRAYEIYPDGMFKCFEAWSLYAIGDFQSSSQAFEAAIESDGLFPDVKNQSLYGAFATRIALYESSQDPTTLDSAIGFLESYIAKEFESHRAEPMFKACCTARRWLLARRIADEMIAKGEPADFWLTKLVDLAIEHGNFGIALSVCDEILEADKNSPVREKRDRVVELIASLREETE